MLADRQYMREPSYRPPMSLTTILLIINVVVFIVECAFYGVVPGLGLVPKFHPNDWFALSLDGLKHWHIWQLITFQFMHAGLLHLALNGLGLFVFGGVMEDTLGKPRFLTLYLASGVFGGLLQEFAAWIWPQYFGVPVVGASAGILGIVAAFAMLYPEQQLQVLLLPITLRAKHLLFIYLAWAALGISFPTSVFAGSVANVAHMGGMLMGLIYIQYFMNLNLSWPWKRGANRTPKRELINYSNSKGGLLGRGGPAAGESSNTEFMSREVDPILDKISAHGIQSLTEKERKILEAARNKVGKR